MKSHVVVFPTAFSRGRIPQLVSNIREMLRIRNQQFRTVRRDGDIILVDASDPVFASSAIGMLFGVRKVAIARQTGSGFESVVSEIVQVGGSLLLRGERFLVRVEGVTSGFVAKDAELAATSRIIETKSELGAHPGTDSRYDKLLYTYLTKNSAYVCIFTDEGDGGIPYEPQQDRTVCAVYDEISAVSCYETIRQGYDVRIIVCYRSRPELVGLARHLSRIIPRLVRDSTEIEFYNVKAGGGYTGYVGSVLGILLRQPEKRVSLAVSAQIFSPGFVDDALRRSFAAKKTPLVPLAGTDAQLFKNAKAIGIGNLKKLEKAVRNNPGPMPAPAADSIRRALGTKRAVTVSAGPNNVHDILDAMG